MADTKTPPKEDKPKGLIGKLKEAAEDKEEQMMVSLQSIDQISHTDLLAKKLIKII